MNARKSVVIANWKMHKTIQEAVRFVKECQPLLPEQSPSVYLAVPFTAIKAAADAAAGSSIVIGAQNASDAVEGAFTGEISVPMLRDVSAQFVLLGHSERRHLFSEGDALINRKVLCAFKYGLQPVLCVGETAQQRHDGIGEARVKEQLLRCLQGVSAEQIAHLIIGYEPIWAIGTGVTATVEQAEEMLHMSREVIANEWGKQAADKVILLYGGSVQPGNARELTAQPNIDGLLVGGASLSLATFMQIVDNVAINK